MAEVSVVLPVYNGAAYLPQTLDALRRQSFEDFEVLCIDDCSTDDSARILQDAAKADARFIYVHTGRNLGTAAKAINFARGHVSGKWFVYSSQDDLFSTDWLSSLHARALTSGADAVIPDVSFYRENQPEKHRISGYQGDRSVILDGKEAFCASLDWSIAGNALWPVSFLSDPGFSEFGAFADEYTVRRFFLKCGKVAFCDGVFYYRQDNAHAITKQASAGRLDEARNKLMIWKLTLENGFDAKVHGPFALSTLRCVIRARAMVINTPSLAQEAGRVDAVWQDLQEEGFAASLETGLTMQGGAISGALYRRAARSRSWYMALCRISALVARRKHKG